MNLKVKSLISLLLLLGFTARAQRAASPDGRIVLEHTDGRFLLTYSGQQVLELASIGITTTLRGGNLTLNAMADEGEVKADYRMTSGKRLHCTNRAHEYTFHFTDSTGKVQLMQVQLYNDGLAFRYRLPDMYDERLTGEQTVYRIPEGTRRWIQKWSEPYEDFYPLSITGRSPENNPAGRWAYPALTEPADGVFALITEAGIGSCHSASSLCNKAHPEYYQVTPDRNELTFNGEGYTPWRVVIVGTLADVTESTLVTDVSAPCSTRDTAWIRPGVVSWIYWAHNHGSSDYGIICQYVDMAADLHLPYVLIDAEWDEMGGGKTIEDAIAYARSRGVKPLIWYNSGTSWVQNAPGPVFRLNNPEDREREFAWCERMGVAGIKIDFFDGDGQPTMAYCLDLLEDARRHHLLVNFHGATAPRGWQRTYPNLMSTEAVYGAEWYNNQPVLTRRAASHNATLPFTRNVIGSMDYTPCTFSDSQHPHITSNAHELALTVLFESGLQHLADRPESYMAQPAEVQHFFSRLPAAWDEMRLLSGYPGHHAVLARRSGKTWYVAGINGTDEEMEIPVPAENLIAKARTVTAFLDGETPQHSWAIHTRTVKGRKRRNTVALPTSVKCHPRGGFVFVVR